MSELNATGIDWEQYSTMERIALWCFINYHITGPILLFVVTIIMLINCKTAFSLLRIEREVWICLYSVRYRRKWRARKKRESCTIK